MASHLPDTIPLGTAVLPLAQLYAKEMADKFPHGCRMGQAKAAVNAALVALGFDWEGQEGTLPHTRWSQAVIQGHWVEY